jgi:hypothetical protein
MCFVVIAALWIAFDRTYREVRYIVETAPLPAHGTTDTSSLRSSE